MENMTRVTYLKKIFLLQICFEIFKEKQQIMLLTLQKYMSSPMFFKNWKKVLLIYLLILSFIYQNDVANMNFYNIKIVILSDK